MNKRVLAVVLGGGKGTRLYPLTQHRSKPAVPIAGKYRLVDIPISNCINSGINKVFILTQYNSASLNRHIKNSFVFDAFTKGFVEILAAEQTPDSNLWYQGTADAIRQSIHHLRPVDFDYVLILSGDQLYQMDFNQLLHYHIGQNADITIATQPVNAKDATQFGIMKTNDRQEITSFIEKPSAEELPKWKSDVSEEMHKEHRDYLASMGIYLFNREVLMRCLAKDPHQTDFGKDIIPDAVKSDDKIFAYQFEGYWTDIGTIRSFFDANLELTNPFPKFNLYDNSKPIYTRARMLPPSKLFGTTVEYSMISEGCNIQAARISRSVVGIRSYIGVNSTIHNSYIMGLDFYETVEQLNDNKRENRHHMGIGDRCHIERAIIDKNARIGNDVKIIGSNRIPDQNHELYTVDQGIVIIKKDAVLPNGFVIQ